MVVGTCLGVPEQGSQLGLARLKIKIIDNFPNHHEDSPD
jgi:hypothetical protein